jgi:hypothetical protein
LFSPRWDGKVTSRCPKTGCRQHRDLSALTRPSQSCRVARAVAANTRSSLLSSRLIRVAQLFVCFVVAIYALLVLCMYALCYDILLCYARQPLNRPALGSITVLLAAAPLNSYPSGIAPILLSRSVVAAAPSNRYPFSIGSTYISCNDTGSYSASSTIQSSWF